jgi:hypothetical protein
LASYERAGYPKGHEEEGGDDSQALGGGWCDLCRVGGGGQGVHGLSFSFGLGRIWMRNFDDDMIH